MRNAGFYRASGSQGGGAVPHTIEEYPPSFDELSPPRESFVARLPAQSPNLCPLRRSAYTPRTSLSREVQSVVSANLSLTTKEKLPSKIPIEVAAA